MYTCEWADRWARLQLPLHSSHLRPPTNCTPFAYTGIPVAHGTAHMKQELLPKNESDVKPRPDWFTSEGHFAPDFRSTCRIYYRKSPVSRSRGISACSFLHVLLASTPKILSLPDFFVKSTGITTLVWMGGRDVV